MEGWRPDRDAHGYRIHDQTQLMEIAEAMGVDPEDLPGGEDHPTMVEALPSLLPALEALEEFLGVSNHGWSVYGPQRRQGVRTDMGMLRDPSLVQDYAG